MDTAGYPQRGKRLPIAITVRILVVYCANFLNIVNAFCVIFALAYQYVVLLVFLYFSSETF